MDLEVPEGGIVLLDGGCGFCRASQRWAERRAPAGRFRFIPLQSREGRVWLDFIGWQGDPPDALVFIEANRHALASTAALRLARRLDGPARAWAVFLIVPRPLRDWVYRLIARHRHRLGPRGPK